MSSRLFPGRRVLWTPLGVPWSAPTPSAAFCCEAMASALAFDCAQHADPFECADHLLVYNEVLDEIGLIVHDGGASYVVIGFCPWCGSKQPESQRDRWYDEIEAKGIGEDDLPPEYASAAWRTA